MRRFMTFLFLILLLAAVGLFFLSKTEKGGTAILNTITPSSTYTLEKDFGFGDNARDRIDFYLAKDSDAKDNESKPLIVFIHGGGWSRGDKSMYKFMAEGLTRRGYDVALPNYRMYPEVIYPEFLNDNARAIAAIHKKYPTRYLVLIGHSAGAYNSLMMAFKPAHLEAEGVYACYTIRGIVSLASPTGAFPMEDAPYTTIFPKLLQGDDAPLNLTDQPLPPMLLINGDADVSVGAQNSEKLAEALAGRNIATAKIYPGLNHTDVVSQFSSRGFLEGPVKDDVVAFIEALPKDEGDGFCKE